MASEESLWCPCDARLPGLRLPRKDKAELPELPSGFRYRRGCTYPLQSSPTASNMCWNGDAVPLLNDVDTAKAGPEYKDPCKTARQPTGLVHLASAAR